jgi:hypothetical protein
MSSILDHPEWPALRPFLRAEAYDRDRNVRGYARRRIEVLTPTSSRLRAWLQGITTPCVACGRRMRPIRERRGWATLYWASCCSLEVNPSCSRTKAAAHEYRRVVEALAEGPHPQRSLFAE